MTTSLDVASKLSFMRVGFFRASNDQFLFGYTNQDYDNTEGGNLYQSMPAMAIELAPNSGLVDSGGELTSKIKIPLRATDTALARMTDGLPYTPVRVRIREFSEALFANDRKILTWVWGNAFEFETDTPDVGWVTISGQSDKAEYDTPSGIVCAGQCANALFNVPCARQSGSTYGPQLATEKRTSAVDFIFDSRQIRVASYTAISSPKTFRRGYLEYQDARIIILDWDPGAPRNFYLAEIMPPSWLGQTVTLVPGCNRTIEACRTQWNNEQRFRGLGYAMPSTDPITDNSR